LFEIGGLVNPISLMTLNFKSGNRCANLIYQIKKGKGRKGKKQQQKGRSKSPNEFQKLILNIVPYGRGAKQKNKQSRDYAKTNWKSENYC